MEHGREGREEADPTILPRSWFWSTHQASTLPQGLKSESSMLPVELLLGDAKIPATRSLLPKGEDNLPLPIPKELTKWSRREQRGVKSTNPSLPTPSPAAARFSQVGHGALNIQFKGPWWWWEISITSGSGGVLGGWVGPVWWELESGRGGRDSPVLHKGSGGTVCIRSALI